MLKVFDHLNEQAFEGFDLRISGSCMEPLLRNGARARVKRYGHYWPGDILVYRNRADRLVAHRLLGYFRRQGDWKLLIQSDSAAMPDPAVGLDRVLGKIVDTPVAGMDRARALFRFFWYSLIGRWIVRRKRRHAEPTTRL